MNGSRIWTQIPNPLISLLAASSVMGRRPRWLPIANPGFLPFPNGRGQPRFTCCRQGSRCSPFRTRIAWRPDLCRRLRPLLGSGTPPLKSAEQLSITGGSDGGLVPPRGWLLQIVKALLVLPCLVLVVQQRQLGNQLVRLCFSQLWSWNLEVFTAVWIEKKKISMYAFQ